MPVDANLEKNRVNIPAKRLKRLILEGNKACIYQCFFDPGQNEI